MRRVTLAVATTLAASLPLPMACQAQAGPDLEQIAQAMALVLDSLNGLPTMIMDEYRCRYREEPCRERPGHVPASLLDASPLAEAFGKARGIPVVHYGGRGRAVCAWIESAAGEAGMWAEFEQPPSIRGDSARVTLATGCGDGRKAFEQVHEFILHLEGAKWRVVLRRLLSIT